MNATPNLPARQDATPLDEVMLAMDIVDTLRHERSTIERELDAEARDEALVARIRGIYAGQGIEVTDELIRKGVEALKQDRFAYVPPKRSLALRLAHVYVERWKWVRRGALVAVLAAAGVVAWRLPQQWSDHRAHAAYSERAEAVGARIEAIDAKRARLQRWHDAQVPADDPARVATGRLVDAVGATLRRVDAQRSALPALAGTDDDARAEKAAADAAAVERAAGELGEIEAALETADAQSRAADRLSALGTRFVAAMLAAADADFAASDEDEVNAVADRAEAALHAGDAALAASQVERLEQIAAQIGEAYELRIVAREGVKSGIWRHPVGNPNARNYYLVVEAIGAGGDALMLPITNEETQKIERVSRFAVRVPEAVYESVKADKSDNGLIDQALVGVKRRGRLAVDFAMPVAGGYITRWED
jgi:hypothetical protein